MVARKSKIIYYLLYQKFREKQGKKMQIIDISNDIEELDEQERKLYLKGLLQEKTCFRCKKKFSVQSAALYVYKTSFGGRVRFFCGWTCLSKFRKERAEIDGRRKKKSL